MNNILKTLESRILDAKVFEAELKFRDETHNNLLVALRSESTENKEQLVSQFMKNTMELSEISLQYARLGYAINELYKLALLENPDQEFNEYTSNFVKAFKEIGDITFAVVDGKLVSTNPDYEAIVNKHISDTMTKEQVERILNSPIVKGQ